MQFELHIYLLMLIKTLFYVRINDRILYHREWFVIQVKFSVLHDFSYPQVQEVRRVFILLWVYRYRVRYVQLT